MNYSIQPFQVEHLQPLVQLLDQSFNIQNTAKTDLIRWKYFDPFHRGDTVMFLALDTRGNVVSHYSNFPVGLAYDGQPLAAMICGDMATDSAHRSKGLISQLSQCVYAEVVSRGVELSIGYSNEAGVKVDQNAKGYGYHVVGRFARYARVLLMPQRSGYELLPTSGFDPAFSVPSAPGFGIHKTGAYLDWRYCRKPNADYQIYKVMRRGELTGYAVLREIGGRCYVHDLIGMVSDDVLRAVQNMALQRGKRLLVSYVLDNAFWRDLLKGWVRVPARYSQGHYYLTVKPHRDDIPTGWDNPESWRLMCGDIL